MAANRGTAEFMNDLQKNVFARGKNRFKARSKTRIKRISDGKLHFHGAKYSASVNNSVKENPKA